MSDFKHPPEPWEFVDRLFEEDRFFAQAADFTYPLSIRAEDRGGREEATMRRVVACVNALAGLPAEAMDLRAVIGSLVWRDRGDLWECRSCGSLERETHSPACEFAPILAALGAWGAR